MNTAVFSHTPTVAVRDARGLSVRELIYHRHPDTPDLTETLITRHGYDARGALSRSTDPRLHDLMQAGSTVKPNFMYVTGLTGTVLRTDSADAGVNVALSDAAGRPALAVNAAGTVRTWQFETAFLPGRPLSVTERAAGQAALITERFVWADASATQKNLNLAGRCVRHYDTAGRVQLNGLALSGSVLSQSRQLLPDDRDADWQGAEEAAWGTPFTDGVHVTLTTADATGAALTTTDAAGNLQRMAYDAAGQLRGTWLTLKDDPGHEQAIVASVSYSAAGQALCEVHGNGVVTTYTYEPQTQRLAGVKTERPSGHAGGAKVLRSLRYDYDPAGNVVKVSDDAQAPAFWRSQKMVPESTYVYDSLYRLVSASGRESANAGQQAAVILPADSNAYTNYSRAYTYDPAGNLTKIQHCSPAAGNSYTTNITVSDKSNRGVLSSLTTVPSQVEALFTGGGQQKQLQPGQQLAWTARGELVQVMPVTREGQVSDSERYRYDSQSQRVLKVSMQKTGNSTQTRRVAYLPRLECRTTTGGSRVTEALNTLTVSGTGRTSVRVLHWESGRPDSISNNQVRYSYGELIQSSGLEVDGDGYVIGQEEYYPFGGTAIFTARNQTEAGYKTVRYSGKERDATGLYYYGYRYYQPWVGRWLSADPAETVDGLNLFRMVRNNPVTLWDVDGLMPTKAEKKAAARVRQAQPGNTVNSGTAAAQKKIGDASLTAATAGIGALSLAQPTQSAAEHKTVYGSHGSEAYSEKISRLQSNRKLFEKAVEQFPVCDLKAQGVLKLINKDNELWKAFHEKLEVRAIKAIEGKKIVLDPEDETKEIWTGKYHVYITVQHEDKRLMIDPYVGGEKSFARVDEREYLKSNWRGEEGVDYILETIAPVKEIYNNDDYTPEFTLENYMYDLFDPDTYESHKFYYQS